MAAPPAAALPHLPAGAPVDPDAVLAPLHRRADRWMGVLIGLHAVLALALAGRHASWGATLWVAGLGVGAFQLARTLRPGGFVTRVTAGLVLQAFCALHIYQMQGMAEMHFFYFTSVTAMIVYQDWVAIWPGVLAIIAQHTLFAAGHNEGWRPGGMQFFDDRVVTPTKLVFHFGIALAQTAIASYAAQALRARTLADAERQRRVEEANATLSAQGAALEAARQAADEARHEAERARAQAEEANTAKSAFLATMSHELRTPLNAIAGHVQLVEMELHGPVTAEQRTALGRVQRSQRHLLALINDVLDFAKLEAGRVELVPEDVELRETLADLGPMIEPQLAARRLAFRVEPGARRAVARADRAKLQQILLNLLSNAVKFTPEGGRVGVVLDATGQDAAGAGVVRLRVWDTGVGIPAEKLEAIFEPFVQANASLTRTVEGTGLGLAISRDLARRMGGELTAASAPGAGATFTLTLPRGGTPAARDVGGASGADARADVGVGAGATGAGTPAIA